MEKVTLLLFPSWEERTLLGFYDEVESTDVDTVIILKRKHAIHQKIIDSNCAKIQSVCESKSIRQIDHIWEENPIDNWSGLESLLKQIDKRMIMDISTMPRDIIWTVLFFLVHSDTGVSVNYYKPSSYNTEWLSKEPLKPRFLLKHSGIIRFGKQTCVIIVTSFDVKRTEQIVSQFEPAKVVLCVQKGNEYNNESRNSLQEHNRVCQVLGVKDIDSILIDCYSEDFAAQDFKRIIAPLVQEYNIIIASFGPKPSAIGIYKAVLDYPEIALCYVPCEDYNENYSIGLGDKCETVFQ